MNLSFKPCAIIPTYNHCEALPQVVGALAALKLPIFIIDDGSAADAAHKISQLHDPARHINVVRSYPNRGKGYAVMHGMRLASASGFTHALQVDADGQHDLARTPDLLHAAQEHPSAVISGKPVYDDSIPLGRKIGRWITHVWVFVETLSFRISDSMCGFRVYPLQETLALICEEHVGSRMDFDTEIIVRLFWRGIPPLMIPVKVIYPPGNTSNFRMWQDNVRISWMHTRLVILMLTHLPRILRHRPPQLNEPHWARTEERGRAFALSATAFVLRLLGRSAGMLFLAPAVIYFWASSSLQRNASREYLTRVLNRPATAFDTLRHYFDFAGRSVDTFLAWTKSLSKDCLVIEKPETLFAAAQDLRGALVIISHHGNAEIPRAMLSHMMKDRLTILVHTHHAAKFNQILARYINVKSDRVLQVTEIGPDTAILLRERVEAGEWIAIAADRIPVSASGRTIDLPFLGKTASFSQGPWLLASLLDCPVYTLFCTRQSQGKWMLFFDKLADRIELPRGQRVQAMQDYVGAYAKRLEAQCRHAPYQWYNFFPFWKHGERA